VAISKQFIAREWLIFLAVEACGFLRLPFWFLVYYFRDIREYGYSWYDTFWANFIRAPKDDPHHLTFLHWFVYPYLGLSLARSVWWAAKTLRGKHSERSLSK